MNSSSRPRMEIPDEDRLGMVLGECDRGPLPPLDSKAFAVQVRHRFYRRMRRRLCIGGGVSSFLLLAIVAWPSWFWTGEVNSPEPAWAAVTAEPAISQDASDVAVAGADAIEELELLILKLTSGIEALKDAERAANERRRTNDAASRVTDQIRQRAEVSVFSSRAFGGWEPS